MSAKRKNARRLRDMRKQGVLIDENYEVSGTEAATFGLEGVTTRTLVIRRADGSVLHEESRVRIDPREQKRFLQDRAA